MSRFACVFMPMKFGIAISMRISMMDMTISSSINVNPAVPGGAVFNTGGPCSRSEYLEQN